MHNSPIEVCVDQIQLILLYGHRLRKQLDLAARCDPPAEIETGGPKWYWPADDVAGIRASRGDLLRSFEQASATPGQTACAAAIRTVIELRGLIDNAMSSVTMIAESLDAMRRFEGEQLGPRIVDGLREFRRRLNCGFERMDYPSCLPQPGETASVALRAGLGQLGSLLAELRSLRAATPFQVVEREHIGVPIGWQQMQVDLTELADEFRGDSGPDAARVRSLVCSAQHIFLGQLPANLPNVCFDDASKHMCARIQTLLGRASRLSRRTSDRVERESVVSEAESVCDWIEGSLRPIYQADWVEVRPARTNSQSTESGRADRDWRSANKRSNGKTRWTMKRAVTAMRKHCERNPWPGMRAWERLLPGCSYGTINNAVKQTPSLRAQRDQQKAMKAQQRKKPDVFVSGTGGGAAEIAATDAPDIRDRTESRAWDELLVQSTPEERDRLCSMSPEQRTELLDLLASDEE